MNEQEQYYNPWNGMTLLVQNSKTHQHAFQLLASSRLPFFVALFTGSLAVTLIIKLQNVSDVNSFMLIGVGIMEPFFNLFETLPSSELPNSIIDARLLYCLSFLLICIWSWSRELIRESVYEGRQTIEVQVSLAFGIMLFLISEAMLFFPFFWAFFHNALSPTIAVGAVWPPEGIVGQETLNPFMLPLVNTVVLLTSGLAFVAAHRSIIFGYKRGVVNGLFTAICLSILFSWLQFLEYGLTKYTITDGTFGSTFFMLTGLHGFHVIVGTVLLTIAYWRAINNQYSRGHYAFFEFAGWYWHFVDVIWLFVFAFIYCWGIDLNVLH